MGTWTLWIAFDAGVVLLLLLDLGLFHRRAHAVSLREAALESAAWVALSVAFGLWILAFHGRGPGLEFFTGYLIEKSLSVDNVFVFLLVFQYFRVDSRYQHRLLFWGILGALLLRGGMIGAGVVLIGRFEWILYVFGAFLLYAGVNLFRADHTLHPGKNLVLRWAENILPMAKQDAGQKLIVRENGRWLATRLLLVVLVLETTDLVFAADSIPAVFGVTRDPFLVYSSNVCAILGLRAFYFLLADILPYFRYLDEGLGIVLMFIGGKMLAAPWVRISTEVSLGIVGGVIAVAVLISVLAAWRKSRNHGEGMKTSLSSADPSHLPINTHIADLAQELPEKRSSSAKHLFLTGLRLVKPFLDEISRDDEFKALLVAHALAIRTSAKDAHKVTVGIAVHPDTFARIRAANRSPALADVPPDQDALEFELHFEGAVALDILTTKAPGGNGAIGRFLEKFGEGIQQVEFDVTNVDRATEILRTRFNIAPIYPATRPGANGTRVNFFLVPSTALNNSETGKKVLVELVEAPNPIV